MDSEDAQREDRLARYVLTGLIVTVCTWALTLMGVADSVIPYVLPPAILILCGRYILVGSISDVEPQAKALASVVGGIALGLVAASGSGYFFTPVPAAGVKGGWMFTTAFIVWVLYRMHTKYEAALLQKVNLKLLLATAAAAGFYGAYGAAIFCLGVVFLMSGIGLSARQPKRVDPNIYLITGSMVVTLAGLAAPLFF